MNTHDRRWARRMSVVASAALFGDVVLNAGKYFEVIRAGDPVLGSADPEGATKPG